LERGGGDHELDAEEAGEGDSMTVLLAMVEEQL